MSRCRRYGSSGTSRVRLPRWGVHTRGVAGWACHHRPVACRSLGGFGDRSVQQQHRPATGSAAAALGSRLSRQLFLVVVFFFLSSIVIPEMCCPSSTRIAAPSFPFNLISRMLGSLVVSHTQVGLGDGCTVLTAHSNEQSKHGHVHVNIAHPHLYYPHQGILSDAAAHMQIPEGSSMPDVAHHPNNLDFLLATTISM